MTVSRNEDTAYIGKKLICLKRIQIVHFIISEVIPPHFRVANLVWRQLPDLSHINPFFYYLYFNLNKQIINTERPCCNMIMKPLTQADAPVVINEQLIARPGPRTTIQE